MKPQDIVVSLLVSGATLLLLSACQLQEGPAERAGKEADKAVADVGRQVEKAGETIKDAAKGDKQ